MCITKILTGYSENVDFVFDFFNVLDIYQKIIKTLKTGRKQKQIDEKQEKLIKPKNEEN